MPAQEWLALTRFVASFESTLDSKSTLLLYLSRSGIETLYAHRLQRHHANKRLHSGIRFLAIMPFAPVGPAPCVSEACGSLVIHTSFC